MRLFVQVALGLAVCLSTSFAAAQNKVVVIPMSSKPAVINTVTSAGQVWMDRNLGALRVATKPADPDAYGTLYQWGRGGDGHEYRSSSTTPSQSNSDVPGHGSFIISSAHPYDWRSPQNNSLWQGESGINNPCPAGFRLPTAAEWETERGSWSSKNAAGAFASPLKLVLAGYRSPYLSTLIDAGLYGSYWSSTVDGSYGFSLDFTEAWATTYSSYRAYGNSVRCIKD